MNYTQEMEQAQLFYNENVSILISKANDYAKQGDCFSNFKFIAQVCQIPIEKTFLQFIAVKLARLTELMGGKVEHNESIDDTLRDLCNYTCLLYLWRKSEREYGPASIRGIKK